MKLSLIFALSAVLSLSPISMTKDVPDDVEIIYPAHGNSITRGQYVSVGIQNHGERVLGVLRDIYIYVHHPNGTEEQVTRVYNRCSDGGMGESEQGSLTANVRVLDEGTYTITWVVMYNQSSDTSKATNTYCGPEPFSNERWNLTRQFEVESGTPGTASQFIPVMHTTSELPSEPTSKGENSAVRANVFGGASLGTIMAIIGILIVTTFVL